MFENITREIVIEAIEKFKEMIENGQTNINGHAVELDTNRLNNIYNLHYEDGEYPPKYILGIAHMIANDTDAPLNVGYNAQQARTILENLGFSITGNNNIDNGESQMSNNIKNIILYGPPGVGKTHNHKRLISLIEEGKSQNEIFSAITENIKIDEELYEPVYENVKEEGRFKFVTFHQNFSYEDFIEGFRPQEDGSIDLEDGIFKNIAENAGENLSSSKQEEYFDFQQFLDDFIVAVESSGDFELEKGLKLQVKKKANGEFQSFIVTGKVKDQSLTKSIIERDLRNFLDNKIQNYYDVKPTYESKSRHHGNAPYYFKLYQKMKAFMDNNADKKYVREKEPQKNFYLIIDEINRGNISKIFGELITLLEEDKRDVMEIELPYSKEPFKVPSNLYIIGTMNSTDKSIALIDIALRRRFTFLKMMPKRELVLPSIKENFKELNKFISKELGEEFQIGHSYFMNIDDSDLDFVLKYKIKPLLEEYFYADKEKCEKAYRLISQ